MAAKKCRTILFLPPKAKQDIYPAIKWFLNHFIKKQYYCLKIFSPAKITDWIKDKNGSTAMCPFCGIDSVIGESSGYPITEAFLKEMKEYWF